MRSPSRFMLPFLVAMGTSLLLPTSPAPAQGNYSLNITSTYDNNSFSIYDRRADLYHQIFAGATHDFSGDAANLTLYYYGALVLFRTYGGRTYNQHQAGGWYVLQLDHREESVPDNPAPADTAEQQTEQTQDTDEAEEEGDHIAIPEPVEIGELAVNRSTPFDDSLVTYLHVRPAVGARFDKREFDFYDSRNAGVNVLLRRHLFGSVLGRAMAETNYKQYPSFPQFTHLEYLGRLAASATVGEGAELFASAEAGYKHYTKSVIATTILSTGGGKGKGGAKKDTVVTKYSTPGATQFVLSAGVVRSLGTDGSIALSYLRRLNPRNTARAVAGEGAVGTSEDEIFDDRYGYQSHEGALVLKTPLAFDFSLEGEAHFQRKVYPQAALDLAGAPMANEAQRRDLRWECRAQITRRLMRNRDGSVALSIGLVYAYVRNLSNSEYHDYHIHQAGLSLSAEF